MGEFSGDLGKALKNVYGKVVMKEARPPSLRGLLALQDCLVIDGKIANFSSTFIVA